MKASSAARLVLLLARFLALAAVPALAAAQACRVLDPELQASYEGRCVNGLAEGNGAASGTAQYRGGFKAGRKHGKGEKRWPNGDSYEGEFVEDRKEGYGAYTWGTAPWTGERYEGEFASDRRQGFGVYRWPSGDAYTGPWESDVMTGPPTPMMQARTRFEEEARTAMREGQKVCREVPVGIALREWLRGTVVAASPGSVGVRIDDAGSYLHRVAGVEVKAGEVLWDAPQAWTPCW
jgi:MORN repeat